MNWLLLVVVLRVMHVLVPARLRSETESAGELVLQ